MAQSNATMISWTRPMLERFKLAYKRQLVYIAKRSVSDDAVFVFDGNEFVPGYAKYLIEYLETHLPR